MAAASQNANVSLVLAEISLCDPAFACSVLQLTAFTGDCLYILDTTEEKGGGGVIGRGWQLKVLIGIDEPVSPGQYAENRFLMDLSTSEFKRSRRRDEMAATERWMP